MLLKLIAIVRFYISKLIMLWDGYITAFIKYKKGVCVLIFCSFLISCNDKHTTVNVIPELKIAKNVPGINKKDEEKDF